MKKCGSATDEDSNQSEGEGYKSSLLQPMILRPLDLG
jgi:hypothetical protein